MRRFLSRLPPHVVSPPRKKNHNKKMLPLPPPPPLFALAAVLYSYRYSKPKRSSVVALFNAISKRQNEGDGKNASGAGKSATVKGASKHAFLDMLKTGVKPGAAAAGAGERTGGSRGGGGAKGGAADAGAGWDKDEGGGQVRYI